jgi:hypothetical protein
VVLHRPVELAEIIGNCAISSDRQSDLSGSEPQSMFGAYNDCKTAGFELLFRADTERRVALEPKILEATMKKLGFVLLAVLLVVVYVVGYWPQHSQLQETERRLQSVSSQLANAQARLHMYSLSDRLARLIDKVEEKNFGDAQKLSSEFFDQVRAEMTQTNDEHRKSVLQSILSKRDAVTTGLANGVSATGEVLRQSLAELRSLVDSASVPGSTASLPRTN